MLHVVTGLPGHGKTLFTIDHVEKLRQASGRPVYYHGIPELTLSWEKLEDPTKWPELPEKAIFVMDEAQTVFRNRPVGSQVPVHQAALEVHRHKGYDLFLMTQDAKNLDAHLRRLVGVHFHLKRAWGLERSRLYKWEGIAEPTDYHDVKRAQVSEFKFPREVYGWYKSADAHTVQKQPPVKKLVLVAGLAIFFAVALWFGFKTVGNLDDNANSKLLAGAEDSAVEQGVQTVSNTVTRAARWSSDWLKPRVQTLPYTAPQFDQVTSVKSFPEVSGCMSIDIDGMFQCECYTQQGTRIEMDAYQCKRFMKEGWFNFSSQRRRYPDIEPYVPPLGDGVREENGGERRGSQSEPAPPPSSLTSVLPGA